MLAKRNPVNKSLCFFLVLLILLQARNAIAQNVGIGTTTPNATLDILRGTGPWGTATFRGTTHYSHFSFGTTEHTYIRGGKAGSHIILNDAGGLGNVGIKTDNPQFPLSFSGALGDKISLWSDGSSTHYGLGIQGGLLQVFSKTVNDDIAFGYGSSSSFFETMRMKGSGVIQFPPALAKKIILYPGTVGDAGFGVFANELRVASDYSGADITFGYDDRTNGFTERFRMKANGALVLSGNAGQNGQVLTSSGGGANTWSEPKTPSFYSFKQSDWQNVMRNNNNSPGEPGGWHVIGGLHYQTITISRTSTVMMRVRVPVRNSPNAFGGVATLDLYLGLYDAANNYIGLDVARLGLIDGCLDQADGFNYKFNLAPGTYYTHVKIYRWDNEDVVSGGYYTGVDYGTLIIEITPQ